MWSFKRAPPKFDAHHRETVTSIPKGGHTEMNSMEPSLPLTKAKQLRSVSHTHTHPTLHPTPQNLRSPSPVLICFFMSGSQHPSSWLPRQPNGRNCTAGTRPLVPTPNRKQTALLQHSKDSSQTMSQTLFKF